MKAYEMNDALQKQLDKMKQDYRVSLENISNEISGWHSTDHWDELIFRCHKYGGSAGTFGLDETSRVLKEFEIKLIALPRPLTDEEAQAYYQEAAKLFKTDL